jgi:glycosyltransferase involved in cell wall biosynthesis
MPLKVIDPHRVFAILVVYGQKAVDCSSYRSLMSTPAGAQMQWLVYDNGSVADLAPPTGAKYEHHPENKGVSAAYLRGATLAEAAACDWLLLLDQDSIFAADWWEAYADAVHKHVDQKLFVPLIRHANKILSPARLRWGRAWLHPSVPATVFLLQQYAPINAGMLIELTAYKACGGHRAAVALDFSDFAFVQNFKTRHTQAVLVDTQLQHQLSGVEAADYELRLRRFRWYCRDAVAYVREGGPAAAILFWCGWRALLLTLRYRRLRFFGVFSRAITKL